LKGIHIIGAAVGLAVMAALGWKEFRPKPAAAASLDIKASCDKRAALSQCSDYAEPAFATGERFLKEPCGVMKGSFSPKACPTDELVGTCFLGAEEVRHYYATGLNPYSLPTAARDCSTSEGKFSTTRSASTK